MAQSNDRRFIAGKEAEPLPRKRCGQDAAANVARMGLLFALAVSLSFLEGLVPLPLPVPGIRLGLSNVVTMYTVFALGACPAFALAALKALFVLFTRGFTASLLSLSGGLVSVAVMAALLLLFGNRLRYAVASMAGAVAHNIGQLAVAAILLRLGAVLWYYLPLLAASGIIMGLLTSVILRAAMPLLSTMAARRS